MTDHVPSEHIEAIVGIQRHATQHYGRAVSAEERFYILHSGECFGTLVDLRQCEFSRALDRGIHPPHWPMDEPVRLAIHQGRLEVDLRDEAVS